MAGASGLFGPVAPVFARIAQLMHMGLRLRLQPDWISVIGAALTASTGRCPLRSVAFRVSQP